MKIVLAADHVGFRLKEEICSWLRTEGYTVDDLGTESEESVDYPLLAERAARQVLGEPGSRGILFCGSGHGMALAANKVRGARAISARSASEVGRARQDGDINIVALGARVLQEEEARRIIEAFLGTAFAGSERHIRRIKQIDGIES